VDIIRDVVVTARKDYHCDASRAFLNCLSDSDLEDAEDLDAYQAAERDGFKIGKGQKHRYCVYTDGGELRTYRGRLDMDRLCQLHEVFED
jgi:hypothetical protein